MRQNTLCLRQPLTPCLLGLFSLVTLMAHALHLDHLSTRQAAWYPEAEPIFAGALAAVRRHLWAQQKTPTPPAYVGSFTSSEVFLDIMHPRPPRSLA